MIVKGADGSMRKTVFGSGKKGVAGINLLINQLIQLSSEFTLRAADPSDCTQIEYASRWRHIDLRACEPMKCRPSQGVSKSARYRGAFSMIRKRAAVFPSTGTACPGEVVLSRVWRHRRRT